MCNLCGNRDDQSQGKPTGMSRRAILGAAGALSLSSLALQTGFSQAQTTPPKAENEISPDAALNRLMTGNERYVNAVSLSVNVADARAALSKGQNPYACIVSCADSRVSPELCFDEERGDLFVTRVAGNFVNTDILASLEYAVAVLTAPLIMVLGHTRCGAIEAAIKAYTQNAAFPGHIQALTTSLAPAVRETLSKANTTDLLDTVIIENVKLNVRKLTEANPILSDYVKQKKLKIVGGVYDLRTGRVDLV